MHSKIRPFKAVGQSEMANVLFFISLLVVLMLIWFDSQKKQEQRGKQKHLNRINVVRKPKTERICGLLNGSQKSANATYTNQTYFGDQLGGKTIERIDRPLDGLAKKVNKTEIDLVQKEGQPIVNQTTRINQKLNKPSPKLGPKKAAKFSFILKLLTRSVWLIFRFFCCLFSTAYRLISILRSMRNSFLSKLAVFYLTVLSILCILAICTTATLKQPASLARLGHHVVQLHLRMLRATLNVLKTSLTFLLLLVALLYPEKHRFESSNHFNHLKFVFTGLIQTILVYLSRLLGYSVFYLTKFEIYFSYLQNYIELAFPSNNEFR